MTVALALPKGWILIENDGALFRGPARGLPRDVWSRNGWRHYASSVKDVSWGHEITEAAALRLIGIDQSS